MVPLPWPPAAYPGVPSETWDVKASSRPEPERLGALGSGRGWACRKSMLAAAACACVLGTVRMVASPCCVTVVRELRPWAVTRCTPTHPTSPRVSIITIQGQRAQAYALLAPIYGWFTEGLDTPDLQEARSLLTALA